MFNRCKKMKKIMVVDDEPDQIETLKIILEDEVDKFKIIGANSGKECLAALQRKEIPDLILLDILMPEMDGWEVFKKIKENPEWEKIPIIFLTATDDKISKKKGSRLAQDFIEKPFEIDDLKKRLKNVLEKNF